MPQQSYCLSYTLKCCSSWYHNVTLAGVLHFHWCHFTYDGSFFIDQLISKNMWFCRGEKRELINEWGRFSHQLFSCNSKKITGVITTSLISTTFLCPTKLWQHADPESDKELNHRLILLLVLTNRKVAASISSLVCASIRCGTVTDVEMADSNIWNWKEA